MRPLRHALLGAAAIVAVIAAKPVYAQQLAIELLPGHPLYDAGEQKAGVAMALSTKPDHVHAADFAQLCEELRVLAGLERENGDGLRLETIFVVPRKRMAVEGYYLPNDGTPAAGSWQFTKASSSTTPKLSTCTGSSDPACRAPRTADGEGRVAEVVEI